MPYILREMRGSLNAGLGVLMMAISCYPVKYLDGIINFCFTSLMNYYFAGGNEEVDYSVLERGMGLLASVQDEYMECVVRPYEKKKRESKEHGGIYPPPS